MKTTQWKVTAQAAKEGKYQPQSGARMLVAASGGPIPTQNHNNEVYHWGLDLPSGNTIKFTGEEESEVGIITVNTESIPQAKPRLAVALDFADIFLRDNEDSQVFEVFESRSRKGAFRVTVSEHIGLELGNIISAAMLTVYRQNGKRVDIEGQVKSYDPKKRELELDFKMDVFDYDTYESSAKAFSGFLALTLRQHGEATKVYNTRSHWIYPIELISRQKEAEDEYEKAMNTARSYSPGPISSSVIEDGKKRIRETVFGYRIQRHSLFGEIPNFDFYINSFPDEYA